MRGNGWIKVWYDTGEKAFWLAEPFTRAQAWMDLQLLACSMSDPENHPGDVKCSLRFLAKRWQWSFEKTRNYLRTLAKDGKILLYPRGDDDRADFRADYRADSRALLNLVNYRSEQGGRTEYRADSGAKTRPKVEEYRRTCRAAEASGRGEKIIPAEYRDRFQTWEEYIEWRYQ